MRSLSTTKRLAALKHLLPTCRQRLSSVPSDRIWPGSWSPPTSRPDKPPVPIRPGSSTSSPRSNEMSTEVETKESATPEISPVAPASPARPPRQRPLWRQRRYQVAGTLVAVALVAAFVANNFLARQYTPEGAIRQYL